MQDRDVVPWGHPDFKCGHCKYRDQMPHNGAELQVCGHKGGPDREGYPGLLNIRGKPPNWCPRLHGISEFMIQNPHGRSAETTVAKRKYIPKSFVNILPDDKAEVGLITAPPSVVVDRRNPESQAEMERLRKELAEERAVREASQQQAIAVQQELIRLKHGIPEPQPPTGEAPHVQVQAEK